MEQQYQHQVNDFAMLSETDWQEYSRHSRSFSDLTYGSLSPEQQRPSNTIDTSHQSTTQGGQRRAREQRRRTDGAPQDTNRITRPNTAHTSSRLREPMSYSQYPDFETIKDPFAKRDKIPRKSDHPSMLNFAAANSTQKNRKSSVLPAPLLSPHMAHSTAGAVTNRKDSLLTSPRAGSASVSANTNPKSSISPSRSRGSSGHNISPRLKIDMNKVDTLYARRSFIFEQNKQRKESRGGHQATSPLSNETPITIPGVLSPKSTSKTNHHHDEGGDGEEEHIPFEQVLIPTAFKRLRNALDDPAFEVDDETYHRFKLSERWYAREEQLQVERSFNEGTFGDTTNRARAACARSPVINPDRTNSLGHGMGSPNAAYQPTEYDGMAPTNHTRHATQSSGSQCDDNQDQVTYNSERPLRGEVAMEVLPPPSATRIKNEAHYEPQPAPRRRDSTLHRNKGKNRHHHPERGKTQRRRPVEPMAVEEQRVAENDGCCACVIM